MIHHTEGAGNVELQSRLASALEKIDTRMFDSIRSKLEVNRKGRVKPYYQFVPSFNHPEPWGVASYQQAKVHKPSGKKKDSRRKGK